MSQPSSLPSISIVVPTRPGPELPASVHAARQLDYPKDKLEIIVAKGRQPSAQRNDAVQAARGEWIYFLDDDALPYPGNLQRILNALQDEKVAMIGGPNLCPKTAPFLEQIFATTLSSWLAFGPSRARYQAVGNKRPSGEKELILCNLIARRSAFLNAGGFDEALYPNEENALMDALTSAGHVLLYDPDFLVERRPRPTLKAFARMVFTYGRGRAEQFKLHPTLGSLPNFVPPAFCAWLIIAPFLGIWGAWLSTPYLLALLLQTLASIPAHGIVRSVLACPLVVLTHIGYGIGFWKGLLSSSPQSAPRSSSSPDSPQNQARPKVDLEFVRVIPASPPNP